MSGRASARALLRLVNARLEHPDNSGDIPARRKRLVSIGFDEALLDGEEEMGLVPVRDSLNPNEPVILVPPRC